MDEVLAELDDQADQLRPPDDRQDWNGTGCDWRQSRRSSASPTRPTGSARRGRAWTRRAGRCKSQLQRQLAGEADRVAEIRLRMQRVHPDVQLTRARTRLEETAGRLQRAAAAYAKLKISQAGVDRGLPETAQPAPADRGARAEAGRLGRLHRTGAQAGSAECGAGPRCAAGPAGRVQPAADPQARLHDHPQCRHGRFITAAEQARTGMTVTHRDSPWAVRSIVGDGGPAPRQRPARPLAKDTSQLSLPIDPPRGIARPRRSGMIPGRAGESWAGGRLLL